MGINRLRTNFFRQSSILPSGCLNSNDRFFTGNLNCFQLTHAGTRPFYYWSYEGGSVDRDFDRCVFDACPDMIALEPPAAKFEWIESSLTSNIKNRLIGEISLNKAGIKKAFRDYYGAYFNDFGPANGDVFNEFSIKGRDNEKSSMA